MSEQLVKYQTAEGVAEILLDRAPVNALSRQVIDQLLAALQRARDDTKVHAVIVASAQKVFCAGLDLDIIDLPGVLRRPVKKSLEETCAQPFFMSRTSRW
ncbi:MAG: enoyl-CoA hydratase/isomerase family protein [Rhodoblastus sp.]|nr:enoyl-CoA hydratase/isomerase family protein [Rhodoblastus sp.]